MPGRFFLKRSAAAVASHLGAEAAGLDDPPRGNVSPGQEIIVCPPDRQLIHMRWGIIPVGRVNARGRPVMETVINARSETVFEKSAFNGIRRCLIPTDGWYEWTGEKRRKSAWRIARADGAPVVFAGIYDSWVAPNGAELLQAAALTCAPNGDVRDIHHRMGVILEPGGFEVWLDAPQEEAAGLLRPLPVGLLSVEAATDVDWDAP